jgi:hypothetical protein
MGLVNCPLPPSIQIFMLKITITFLLGISAICLYGQVECHDIQNAHSIYTPTNSPSEVKYTGIQQKEDTLTFITIQGPVQGTVVYQQRRYRTDATFLDSSALELPPATFYTRTGASFLVFEIDSNNFMLTRLGLKGDVIWQKNLFLANINRGAKVYDADIAEDGSIYLCGFVPPPAQPPFLANSALLVRLDSAGQFIWAKTYPLNTGPGDGYQTIYIVGEKVFTYYTPQTSSWRVLSEFAPDGTRKWENQITAPAIATINGIAPYPNKGIVMTRFTYAGNGPSNTAYLTVIDSAGSTQSDLILGNYFANFISGVAKNISGIQRLDNGHYLVTYATFGQALLVHLDENLVPVCYKAVDNLNLVNALQLDNNRVAVLMRNTTQSGHFSYVPGFIPAFCTADCYDQLTNTTTLAKDTGLLSVFPNPANTNVQIRTSEDHHLLQLRVIDTQGQVRTEHSDIDHVPFTLDVGALPNGTYMLSAVTNKGLLTKRLLVLR